ncbi:MAG: GNAT family N-acetyltransferase [Candidatus Izemoplasmatales bacterium]
MIRAALLSDLNSLVEIASKIREQMKSVNLKQWLGNYPNYEDFYKDFQLQGLFVYELNEIIVGSISILPENDPPYREINWDSSEAVVIHRIMVDPSFQRIGIASKLFRFAINYGREKEYVSLKIDTHPDNQKMQNLICKFNFKYKGYIKSINRLAYEIML